AHLSAVREHLAVPGRYVVESGHPAEYLAGSKRVETEWDLDRAGHHVHIRWGKPDDEMDPVTQVTPYLVTITIDGEIAAEEIIANRFWTATELEAAGRLAGLTVSARYGDFREDLTLSDDRAWRMFTVFARGG
ncbi:MAG TPA: hypothetical protein VFE14_00610, partial [Micromonosporaceae bacterium]|nr:hypothetical protein [Micromonosporaceae bacterium]